MKHIRMHARGAGRWIHPAASAASKKGGAPTMVLVKFAECGIPLSYYNCGLKIKPGDIVFVEGKYEGIPGVVKSVSRNFNVDLCFYKEVKAVSSDRITDGFCLMKDRLLTFDPNAVPFRKALNRYKTGADDYFIIYDEDSFFLDETSEAIDEEIMFRGIDYYKRGRVAYLSLHGEKGNAIVVGTKPYRVRFNYVDGEISELTCDCPCGFICKHEAAVLLLLNDTLKFIEKKYALKYAASDYFATVTAEALLVCADGRKRKYFLAGAQ